MTDTGTQVTAGLVGGAAVARALPGRTHYVDEIPPRPLAGLDCADTDERPGDAVNVPGPALEGSAPAR